MTFWEQHTALQDAINAMSRAAMAWNGTMKRLDENGDGVDIPGEIRLAGRIVSEVADAIEADARLRDKAGA